LDGTILNWDEWTKEISVPSLLSDSFIWSVFHGVGDNNGHMTLRIPHIFNLGC
jgi:hypothetical protein